MKDLQTSERISMGFPWISECWGSSISRCCNIYFFAWFPKGFLLFLLGLWVGLDPTSNSKDSLQRHHSRSWQYPHQNCAFGRRYSRKHQWFGLQFKCWKETTCDKDAFLCRKESPLECLDAFRTCLSQMSVKKCLHLGAIMSNPFKPRPGPDRAL